MFLCLHRPSLFKFACFVFVSFLFCFGPHSIPLPSLPTPLSNSAASVCRDVFFFSFDMFICYSSSPRCKWRFLMGLARFVITQCIYIFKIKLKEQYRNTQKNEYWNRTSVQSPMPPHSTGQWDRSCLKKSSTPIHKCWKQTQEILFEL